MAPEPSGAVWHGSHRCLLPAAGYRGLLSGVHTGDAAAAGPAAGPPTPGVRLARCVGGRISGVGRLRGLVGRSGWYSGILVGQMCHKGVG